MGDLPYIFLHFHPPVYFKFDSILVEKKKKERKKRKEKRKNIRRSYIFGQFIEHFQTVMITNEENEHWKVYYRVKE